MGSQRFSRVGLIVAISLAPAWTAAAAAPGMGKAPKMAEDDFGGGGGGGEYRLVQVSMPIVTLNREAVGRVEFNLAGNAAVAVEAQVKRRRSEIDEEETKETGERRAAGGRGGAIFLSRYTQPWSMAGFYWSVGAGYREETVSWTVQPDEKDPAVDYALVGDDNLLRHEAGLRGATGHFRVGYRHVGTEIPLLVGIYAGARHFQAGVQDRKLTDEDRADMDSEPAPMTDRERERLRRKYATSPEAGLEVGFTF